MPLLTFLEVILATSIWGFGFTATIWALRDFGPLSITVIRFGSVFIIGFLIFIILNKKSKILDFFKNPLFYRSRKAGFFLGLTLALQTWGLLYTTATKSAFITILYILWVPLLESLFLKKKVKPLHYLWVFLALIGMSLLSNMEWKNWNQGDFLCLLCSLTAAAQIILIGHKKIAKPFEFNVYQSFWACLIILLAIPFSSESLMFSWPLSKLASIGILSLIFCSSILGFYLQIKIQQKVSPSLASLLFLLESPLSYFFAFIFLNEKLNLLQTLGTGFILAAAILAIGFHKK